MEELASDGGNKRPLVLLLLLAVEDDDEAGNGWRAAKAAAMAAALSLWTLCRCSRRTAGDGKPLLHSQHLAKYSATTPS